MASQSDRDAIKITAEDLATVAVPQSTVVAGGGQLATGAKVYGTINETAEQLVSVSTERGSVFLQGWFYLGAAGLLWRPTRRLAGIMLFLLTLAVTPAHIYMLQRPELFNIPYGLLIARLPLQAALLALIAWATFPTQPGPRRPCPGMRD